MLVYVVRFVFILSFAVAAAQLAQVFRLPPPFSDNPWKIMAVGLYVVIGAGVGYVLGGVVGRRLTKALDWIENRIKRIPASDILVAVGGLILGLVVAWLVSLPMWQIPGVGLYLSIAAFTLLGYLGLWMAYHKREDLRGLFSSFSRGTASPVGDWGKSDYVEKILDTSVIIDGRITDICRTGFVSGRLNLPRFILRELQTVADSEDSLKRNRGRRGLDVLNTLQRDPKIEVRVLDTDYPEITEADGKLVRLAKEMGAALMTNDYNLNKIAELQGALVLNINELANALKPVVLPGEEMNVHVIREGKEAGQGVAYLDDGTMVIVDGGKERIGDDVQVMVTSVLQTPAGRMIFTKLEESTSRL